MILGRAAGRLDGRHLGAGTTGIALCIKAVHASHDSACLHVYHASVSEAIRGEASGGQLSLPYSRGRPAVPGATCNSDTRTTSPLSSGGTAAPSQLARRTTALGDGAGRWRHPKAVELNVSEKPRNSPQAWCLVAPTCPKVLTHIRCGFMTSKGGRLHNCTGLGGGLVGYGGWTHAVTRVVFLWEAEASPACPSLCMHTHLPYTHSTGKHAISTLRLRRRCSHLPRCDFWRGKRRQRGKKKSSAGGE